jgi:hypothetical protein
MKLQTKLVSKPNGSAVHRMIRTTIELEETIERTLYSGSCKETAV